MKSLPWQTKAITDHGVLEYWSNGVMEYAKEQKQGVSKTKSLE
jgi:hypothetical protein